METRLAAIEAWQLKTDAKIDRIYSALQRLEPAIRDIGNSNADINAGIAAMEGQLKAMPTVLPLIVAILSTWTAGAAIVFALLKATHP